MAKTSVIAARFESPIAERIQQLAAAEGEGTSVILRRLVRLGLEKQAQA